MHDGGGGIDVAVKRMAEESEHEFRHVLLRIGQGSWTLETPGDDPVALKIRWGNPFRRLARWLDLDLCHVHHLTDERSRVHAWLLKSALPFVVTLHDFHWVCPRVHMVPPGDTYCGAPTAISTCENCLAKAPAWTGDLGRWRREATSVFSAARVVTAPTRFTGETVARYSDELKVTWVPHRYLPEWPLVDSSARQGDYSVIAVVGALGREKGGELIESIAMRARDRQLPLRFVVIGDTHLRGGPQSLYEGYLYINGSYQREALPALLSRYNPRLAAFPAIWPETFCLTLSEVLRCGLPVCVPGFGALAERVRRLGGGAEVVDWTSPDAWLDTIMQELQDEEGGWHRAALARDALARETGDTDYPSLYRAALETPGEGAHGRERMHS